METIKMIEVKVDMDDQTMDNIIEMIRSKRGRTKKAERYENCLRKLLSAAAEDGYVFLDTSYGFVYSPDGLGIYDEKA